MKSNTYARSGVDIDRGDRFVEFVRQFGSPVVGTGIGGFSGSFEIDTNRYRHPVLMSTTDGVGTKILVAQKLKRYDTIGIDLVAMCVNDLLVCGAEPVSFLDYIACAKIDEELFRPVITGVIAGCEQAGCTLAGGETAELPDMYREGEFDLAGFAVGLVERDGALPKPSLMREGDPIMALPSVGVHANGLSLARNVIPPNQEVLWTELLRPTKIYAKEMKALYSSGVILGAAHITGGGLNGNVGRILPPGLSPRFDFRWPVPEIFSAIQRFGRIEEEEMRRVFNMGVGIAFVVSADNRKRILTLAVNEGIDVRVIGELVRG